MLDKLNYIFKGLVLSKKEKESLINVLNNQPKIFKLIRTLDKGDKLFIDDYELEYYYATDGGNAGSNIYCHGEELYNKLTKKLDYFIDNKIPCFLNEIVHYTYDGGGEIAAICIIFPISPPPSYV